MLHLLNLGARARGWLLPLLFAILAGGSGAAQETAEFPPVGVRGPITTLLELAQTIERQERVVRDLRLEGTVCASTDPGDGVIILQDATSVQLIEWGEDQPKVVPGEKIRIEGRNCLLRRRDVGVSITSVPVVDNDGIHFTNTVPGEITLTAGRHPLRVE